MIRIHGQSGTFNISDRNDSLYFGDGFDFTDPDLVLRGIPVNEFAKLRRNAPIWWNAQRPGKGGGFNDGGYWVISKHKHVREISRNSSSWSSNLNTAVLRYTDDMSTEQLERNKLMLINQDAPQHTRLRKLVTRSFTVRAIHTLEEGLRESAKVIVGKAREKGMGDFVADVSSRLPMLAIFDLLGVPEDDRELLFGLSNRMMNFEDDEFDDATEANMQFLEYARAMAAERKQHPTDDIVTTLVTAEVDGTPLTELEFGFFFLLLTAAGNETTRNATAHGLNAFMDNPDQWSLYKRHRPKSTAEEIVRFATPIIVFQRTALHDVELDGIQIKSGQRVGLFYASANFDEDVFGEPHRFNIFRDPNPHLGYGGSGAHYCIGANLARLQLNLIFNELADQCPDITKRAEPERLRSPWVNGIKRLPVDYGK